MKVFKNTCKISSRALKISTIGLMFKLLDQFASTRENQAPVIYKLLVFALVENIEDEDVREFMMRNFTCVFLDHKSIPVSILIEPLLRIIQLNEKMFILNVFDYNFFAMLATHSKITASPIGLQLMDMFARFILNDPIWQSSACVPFMQLAERFKDEPQIQDFLLKFSTLAVTSVLMLH